MNKAVFFDRDGTLIVDKGYLADPEGVELYHDAGETLRALRDAGYLLFVITNQSGIGRGFFTEEEYKKVHARFMECVANVGAKIDATAYCTHAPEERCACRKPKTLLLTQLAEAFNIDVPASWVVGDKMSDVMLGKNAGAQSILMLTGYGAHEATRDDAKPFFKAKTLTEVQDHILSGGA